MQNSADAINKPLGVIDALQRGFNFITYRPWLLLLPVLVDLFLWRGPRLSLAPLIDRWVETIVTQPQLPADYEPMLPLFIESSADLGTNFNLFSLLSGAITGFPSLLTRLDIAALVLTQAPVIALERSSDALLYTVVLIPLGLLISSVWLAWSIYYLQADTLTWKDTVRRAGWIWLNVGLYLLGLIVGTLLVTFIFSLVASFILLLIGPAGSTIVLLLFLLGLVLATWLAISLTFVSSAIALDGVNVARAAWRSVNVVGRNPLGTMGLLIVSFLLMEGFTRIWLRLSANTWGVPLSILGNAYIGAALTVAALIFYRARYQQWQLIRSTLIQTRRHGQDDVETDN